MSQQRTFTEGNEMVATALATAEQSATNPLSIIQTALERGADPDQLEKLMALQERWEKNRAAEAYSLAVTSFQAKCPRIFKERTAKIVGKSGGNYEYKFAGYDDVMEVVGPVLAEFGLAISFSTEAIEKGIRITIKIRKGIHAEECTMDVPIPAMNVNDTQRYGAALSYAKRYAFCAALNIVTTSDVDDDAASCLDPVTDEQLNVLDDLMVQVVAKFGEDDRRRFLKLVGVERLSDIPAKDFEKAERALRKRLSENR